MLKQLTTMVAKMGDLISSAETAASLGLDSSENENNNMRGVVHAISKNIQDLVVVLCSPGNASLFLKFDASNVEDSETTEIKAEDQAGPRELRDDPDFSRAAGQVPPKGRARPAALQAPC